MEAQIRLQSILPLLVLLGEAPGGIAACSLPSCGGLGAREAAEFPEFQEEFWGRLAPTVPGPCELCLCDWSTPTLLLPAGIPVRYQHEGHEAPH